MATATIHSNHAYYDAPRPSSSSKHPGPLPPSSPPAMTTASLQAPRPRRIRFAPLPDPHRAVLVTDDGDELPVPLPDDNTFPTSSLLLPIYPAAFSSAAQASAESCDPDPPPLALDPADPERSSGSSTNSYLSSASSSASPSASSTPRTTTPSEYSPVSSVGSSPVALHSALPKPDSAPHPVSVPAAHPAPAPAAAQAQPKPRAGMSLLRPFRKASPATSSSGSSSHSLTPTPSIDAQNGKSSGSHTRAARKALSALSTEEILTLGTINLFRTSSRDSNDSTSTTTGGWGLARWASAGNNNSSSKEGLSLARTQSTQSYRSKSRALFGPSPLAASSSSFSTTTTNSSPSSASPTTPKPTSRHKGARMLNGRVYGSKRNGGPPANPFASARDEEPEFVEWGYGGMGSVRGARSAGVGVNWERLHGGAAVREGVGVAGAGKLDDGEERRKAVQDARKREMGIGGTAGLGTVGSIPEEDDGSGMGWVKRRREERERKAKEAKEAAERAAAGEEPGRKEGADEEEEENGSKTPTPTRASTLALTPINTNIPAAVPHCTPTTTASIPNINAIIMSTAADADALLLQRQVESSHVSADADANADAESMEEEEELEPGQEQEQEKEHVPLLVPVPAPARHHHHHHSRPHSRAASAGSLVGLVGESYAAAAVPGTKEDGRAEDDGNSGSGSGSGSESESASDSEKADSEGDDDDDDDEDEDEDEDSEEGAAGGGIGMEGDGLAAQRRKTMLGAGVEKVMRHKE